MNRRAFLVGTALAALAHRASRTPAAVAELSAEVRHAVERGLAYLARTQGRDGQFVGNGGQYPTALTSLAGLAFLMEGSTPREGKYAANVRRITDFLIDRARPNGLIADAANPRDWQRYTYAHGFATLFLACGVYGEEENRPRRRQLEGILTRAVEFIGHSQTSKGGWGYLARGSFTEGDDQDEGSTTITQLQALRAARNAGIAVPRSIIDNARKYMESVTTPTGGVLYKPGQPGERPALTAAAIVCGYSFGEYDSPIVKKWIKSAQTALGPLTGPTAHDEYAHFYFAQAAYMLDDDRYAKLFPGTPRDQWLTWSGYKAAKFKSILARQSPDGSWTGSSGWSSIGTVFTTATYLCILQLDNGVLPIFQR